jgi:hypothetical protein
MVRRRVSAVSNHEAEAPAAHRSRRPAPLCEAPLGHKMKGGRTFIECKAEQGK